MKVQRYRDRKVLDLRDSEAHWLVDHGFATAVEDEAPKPKRAARKPKASTQSDSTDSDDASTATEPADAE